jgi:hypothetical protein
MRSCAVLTELKPRTKWAAAAAFALATLIAAAVYLDRNQIWLGDVYEASISPEFVTPVGTNGDPLNVLVGFAYTETGYCAGQFHAKAKESATQIRVGAVISRTYSGGNCAGLGSNGKTAVADLALDSPIGKRLVVRDSDGVALPVFALDSLLDCKSAIASRSELPPDAPAVFDRVALQAGALQAEPSGESDPHAAFFAKSALFVASGASVALSVPEEWMGRLTIGWGGPGTRSHNFHVSGCAATASQHRWLVFAGGFWIDSPACVPVLVRSGAQEEIVHVGVGAPCP